MINYSYKELNRISHYMPSLDIPDEAVNIGWV
jgi:hypothetical protein